ncbi:hypothetical protein CHARACLAT_024163 [Characodon lateralis]|uniref:Uncharacterized protein n=1 Tax=Characodon lateralis TaxID=208331 RepID=A0ABU7CRH1_9TELE|nr:hypothetical protein [Characodon lateralis]
MGIPRCNRVHRRCFSCHPPRFSTDLRQAPLDALRRRAAAAAPRLQSGYFQALGLFPVRFLTSGSKIQVSSSFSRQTPSWQRLGSAINRPKS